MCLAKVETRMICSGREQDASFSQPKSKPDLFHVICSCDSKGALWSSLVNKQIHVIVMCVTKKRACMQEA